MNTHCDERLTTLNEIANDCFGIESFTSATAEPGARYSVCAEDIVRALESAYDIGLIVGCQMDRSLRAKS